MRAYSRATFIDSSVLGALVEPRKRLDDDVQMAVVDESVRSDRDGNTAVMVAARRACRALATVLLAGGLLTTPLGASSSGPVLRSAISRHRHIVVTFTVADLRPWVIEVAVARTTDVSGQFLARNVRLRELITARPDSANAVLRWRTSKSLPPRRYDVEVSGVETDGVTDCLPQLRDCLVQWSNVQPVVVR